MSISCYEKGENINIWSTAEFIMDINKDIHLYKQKILWLVNGADDNDGIEILSRLWEKRLWPELYLRTLSPWDKVQFDYQVLEKAMVLYQLGHIGTDNFHINIHPTTLMQKDFYEKVISIFDKYDFQDFHKISIEVLENGKVFSIEQLNRSISLLQRRWIKVGLDDYPNENNTNELLSMINTLDFVKIDKHFILSLTDSNGIHVQKIIQGLVDDIRNFHPDTKIVIEWVENEMCLEFIKTRIQWIDYVQGYNFWKPIPIII